MTKKRNTSSKKKTTAAGRRRCGKKGNEITSYLGKYVVVDSNSHFIYIGKLLEVGDRFITLGDADAHDCRESPSTNEKYIIDAKKYGVRCNRKIVHIRAEEVISISSLDNVIEY